jgi:hypothetical protein
VGSGSHDRRRGASRELRGGGPRDRGEIRRSIERASQADPEEIARAVGLDPGRVRELLDNAGEWLSSQQTSEVRLSRSQKASRL